MKFFPLALLLLLGACGVGGDTSTPQGQCRAMEAQDPDVQALQLSLVGAQPSAVYAAQGQMRALRQQAYMKCLRGRGLAPAGGGVQPLKS
ncbi:MAG: hypothetical protein KGJ41_08390 [Rhodospirillales bacterium]|nr:hypothetical protein [Rhodospirillales bacterium]MDE2199028.1 hypothetical protein [Rhodospirillales bacterium]MDE2574199.1 hypothetical protein [Rhodospirillales bacterium]